MPAFHQMGHDTKNLLDDTALDSFNGTILSPVNYTEDETRAQVERHEALHFVFDPQLYFPQTNRGVLKQWTSYYPADVDTADQTSLPWFKNLVDRIIAVGGDLGVDSICSPAIVPRTYSDDFFDVLVQIGSMLADASDDFTPVQTLLVPLNDLADRQRAYTIASIMSRTCRMIYLVFVTDVEPRRELADAAELTGAMLLIWLLEQAGLNVIVGFSSTDIVLWKAAGATSCATGKFFDLRRFTKSRFEEPAGGGGQLPYWIEESRFAYLRETEVLRVRDENLISEASRRNPLHDPIFEAIAKGDPWLALSWRHYVVVRRLRVPLRPRRGRPKIRPSAGRKQLARPSGSRRPLRRAAQQR